MPHLVTQRLELSQIQPLNGSRFNPLDSSIEPPYFAVAFDWLMPHLVTQRLELAPQLAPSVTRQPRDCGFDCPPARKRADATFHGAASLVCAPLSPATRKQPRRREGATALGGETHGTHGFRAWANGRGFPVRHRAQGTEFRPSPCHQRPRRERAKIRRS